MTKSKKRKKKVTQAGAPETGAEDQVSSQPEEQPAASEADAGCQSAEPVCGATEEPSESPAAEGEGTVFTLNARVKELEEQCSQYMEMVKRTRAEFDNFRKRKEREMGDMKRQSLGDFLKSFFPALDDLDRAIGEGETKHDYDVFHDGVKMVRENIWKVMEKQGVVEMHPLGEKFNPELHEAMTAIPSPDHAPNTVVDVFEKGYMLDEFVLRPARVIVAAAAPQSADGSKA